jgi:hypothetical protein
MNVYPNEFQELMNLFSTEHQCREYIFNLRWSDGFQCPKCRHTKYIFINSRNKYRCKKCRKYEVTVTSETIFHGTHKSLTFWFCAIWYITSPTGKINASGLKKELGLGSYQTAWKCFNLIRKTMLPYSLNELRDKYDRGVLFNKILETAVLPVKYDELVRMPAEKRKKLRQTQEPVEHKVYKDDYNYDMDDYLCDDDFERALAKD